MTPDTDAARPRVPSKFDFLLSWPIPITIAVLGSQFGGFFGLCLTLPLAVATGAVATLALTKSWSVALKAGALGTLYAVAAAMTWLVLGFLLPAMQQAFGLA